MTAPPKCLSRTPHRSARGSRLAAIRTVERGETPPGLDPRSRRNLRLLLRLFEISQIRRRLVFADWHQHAVSAHEIAVPADSDQRAVHAFGTAGFVPSRTRLGVVHIFFVHGPRSREGV